MPQRTGEGARAQAPELFFPSEHDALPIYVSPQERRKVWSTVYREDAPIVIDQGAFETRFGLATTFSSSTSSSSSSSSSSSTSSSTTSSIEPMKTKLKKKK